MNSDGSLLNVFALVGSDPNPDPNAVRELPTQELALRSVDGGRTWSKPITIGHSGGRDIHDPVTGQGMNIYDTFPAETVAPNGDVYVTWSQPGATSSRVVVARSQNGGRTWSSHYLGVRGQVSLPSIGVAGDGTVGVTYYKASAASSGGILADAGDLGQLSEIRVGPGALSPSVGSSICSRRAAMPAPAASSATTRAWRACSMAWSQRPR